MYVYTQSTFYFKCSTSADSTTTDKKYSGNSFQKVLKGKT